MNGRKVLPVLLLLAAFSASSCSGPKPGQGVGGGGGGANELLNVTVSARPDSVPGTISILSFTADISEISITDSSGLVMNITPSNPNVDLNKLLSDSAYLGHANPASSILMASTITISSAQVVYCTSTTGVAGCTAGSIKTVTAGSATVNDGALPTFPSNATKMGMRLNFDLQNALVLNGAGTAVTSLDFKQPLVLEWVGLPESENLTSPQLDYIEDITGVVTSASSTSVTIQSATAGTFTANIVSGTSNLLGEQPAVGQVADIDAILNDDGTYTLLMYDELASSSVDLVEGVIGYVPTAGNQFQFTVTNFQQATAGSFINANLHLGDPVTVNLSLPAGTTFLVDGQTLTGPTNSFSGASDTSALSPGQVVAVFPTAFTGANGATPASVTVNGLMLRFSRLAGFPSTAGPNFPFLPVGQYFGIQTAAATFETTGVTNSEPGGALTPNTPAAIRALYFGSNVGNVGFAVAKVRQ